MLGCYGCVCLFFNDTATNQIYTYRYTLSLLYALPNLKPGRTTSGIGRIGTSRDALRLALCGGLVVLGFLVLIGWSLGMETLKSVIPGQSTMKVNTAIGFVLVGFGLAAAGRRGSGAAVIAVSCGVADLLLGLLTLVEYLEIGRAHV